MANPNKARPKKLCSRSAAALAIAQVLKQEASLNGLFDIYTKQLPSADIGLFKALCFGCLRFGFSLQYKTLTRLKKPLRKKDLDVQALIMVGIYQLEQMHTPSYAAVDGCVKAAVTLNKSWAKGLLNAILRNYKSEEGYHHPQWDHPKWLYKQFKNDWPKQLEALLTENNIEPPLCIRVNQQKTTREALKQTLLDNDIDSSEGLLSPHALYVTDRSAPLLELDVFHEGHFSVQDEAAQCASLQFDLKPHQNVLDACAAPGGKTCHLLEIEPSLAVTAIDQDETRLARVTDNLARLGLQAETLTANAESFTPKANELFDHILCDVPCSGTGVIRRHPDIKFLRNASDIDGLNDSQLAILHHLWQWLKPGGTLLYTTCSTLKAENHDIIASFLGCTSDANLQPLELTHQAAQHNELGTQLFPVHNGQDGFYYAKLTKGLTTETTGYSG